MVNKSYNSLKDCDSISSCETCKIFPYFYKMLLKIIFNSHVLNVEHVPRTDTGIKFMVSTFKKFSI